MKRLSLYAVAAVCVGVALSFAPLAHAGETPIGIITITDGGTATNRCNAAAAFDIGNNVKLTLQCDAGVYVQTNAVTAPAGSSLSIEAGEKFPTSVGAQTSRTCFGVLLSDAGVNPTTSYNGHLAISAVSGATASCKVFVRTGTE
jgi:hypothetical protein